MIVPVSDLNPTRRRAVITMALIATNVAVFLLIQERGGCPEARFLFEWAAIPRELVTMRDIGSEALRPLIGGCALGVEPHPPLVTAITAMFLHSDIGHLFFNMLFLWVFGNNVEDRLGRIRFLVFYLGTGLVATFVFAALHANTLLPLLGASGAVAGILGAYLLLFPRAQVRTYVPFPLSMFALLLGRRLRLWLWFFAIVELPAYLVLGSWFALQVVAAGAPDSIGGGVAYSAHVSGFVSGLLVVYVVEFRRRHTGSAR